MLLHSGVTMVADLHQYGATDSVSCSSVARQSERSPFGMTQRYRNIT